MGVCANNSEHLGKKTQKIAQTSQTRRQRGAIFHHLDCDFAFRENMPGFCRFVEQLSKFARMIAKTRVLLENPVLPIQRGT